MLISSMNSLRRGNGIMNTNEVQLKCMYPGQSTMDMVFGNGMDLFMVNSVDGSQTQTARDAFRFDKQIVINVASSRR